MTIFACVTLAAVVAAMLAGAFALSRHVPPRTGRPRSRGALGPLAAGVLAACAGLVALMGPPPLAVTGLLGGTALYSGLISWAIMRGPKSRGTDEDEDSDGGGNGPTGGPPPGDPLGGLDVDWARFERDAFRAYRAHSERELAGAV
jgi:hypothetical protein